MPYAHLKKTCPRCDGIGVRPFNRGLCDACSGSGKVSLSSKDVPETLADRIQHAPFPARVIRLLRTPWVL